jgi:hypothetical protein
VAPGRAGERGSALVFVLFLLVLFEVAMMMAALQIQWASSRYVYEHERLVADRLSEAGLAHAAAMLAGDPAFRGSIDGTLLGGSYAVRVVETGLGRLELTSVGTTPSRRAVKLVVEVVRTGGGFSAVRRDRTHFVGGGT